MGAPTYTMVEESPFDMRLFETALLCGDASTLNRLQTPVAADIVRGHLAPAVGSAAAVAAIATAISSTGDSPEEHVFTPLEKYVTGVALLLSFLRDNWGGPSAVDLGDDLADEESVLKLGRDGEDVAPSIRSARYIAAARVLLIDGLPGLLAAGATLAPWWGARVSLAHSAVLSAPTPTLRDEVFSLFGRFLGEEGARSRFLFADVMGSGEKSSPAKDDEEEEDWELPVMDGLVDEEDEFKCLLPGPGEDMQTEDIGLGVLGRIELALAQKTFYDTEGAMESIEKATELAGIKLCISGELGMRTKFQSKATAQLIARAFSCSMTHENDLVHRDALTGLETVFPRRHADASDVCRAVPLPGNVPTNDSDVLGFIKLAENNAETGADSDDKQDRGPEIVNLTPLDQALVLAHASIVRARNAAHLLTDQQMAPYVNLVLKNETSIYGTSSLVQIKALMMRVSFESERGRYLERCMAQMETITSFIDNQMTASSAEIRNSAVAERGCLTFASASPPRWEVKKQLAVCLGNIGLVKSAMEIFKDIGFWDELVDCHRLVGNLGAAESLVHSQLKELDDAVTEADEAVRVVSPENHLAAKARLTRSRKARSARRPRLLCVLGDIRRDTAHLEKAWIESGRRYTRAKRALGRFAVDGGHWQDAVEHFRDALAINPLFPDVWFSYGCAALELQDFQTAAEAFTQVIRQTPDFGEGWNNLGRSLVECGRKKEALKALCEAARVTRDSWRIWDNVLMLATELRNTDDALRAIGRLLDLRGREAEFQRPLCRAVEDVIRRAESKSKEERQQAGPLCRRLLEVLSKATSIDATNGSVWAAYSDLHELAPQAGGAEKAFDCRLKQVRVLVAEAQWNQEKNALRRMALASIALCRLAMKVRDRRSLRAAQLHMQSIMEQTVQDFRGDHAFVRIAETKQELEEAVQAAGFNDM